MSDLPSVEQAWSAVKKDVGAISKSERNKQQGFNFRGVDTVVNAVSPVLDKHGVFVTPYPEDITTTIYKTDKGTTMHSAIVKMRYTVRGPAGDSFDGGAYGEAADAGDKAVSKAQSVAYRVFLLQGLTIPTDEADPDQDAHQRATPAQRQAPSQPNAARFTEIANAMTGAERAQLRTLLIQEGLPSSPQEMSEDQAEQAIRIAKGETA